VVLGGYLEVVCWRSAGLGADSAGTRSFRPLPNDGGIRIAPDRCCAAVRVYFFLTSACGRQQPGEIMLRVLARVLKEFVPVFSTAFECFC